MVSHTLRTVEPVGYRGKVRDQEAARGLRAAGRTLQQIADELGVSKSSVSLWVRDVPFTPSKRRWGPQRRPNPASRRKQRETQECNQRAAHWMRVTGVPRPQFRQGYRAVADPTIRTNKHEYGCCYVYYCCTRTHRQIMGLIRALLSSDAIPG
jgi:hypothetical protein